MNYAASAPVSTFIVDSIDHGAMAQSGAGLVSALKNLDTAVQANAAATGISSAGRVAARGIVGAAQDNLIGAQNFSNTLGTVGQLVRTGASAYGNSLDNSYGGTSPGTMTPIDDFFTYGKSL